MAPIPKEAEKALNAMQNLGFPVQTTKKILKNLLKLYDFNWVHIEAENYKLLVDTILDSQESEEIANNGNKEVMMNDDPEPLKEHPRKKQDEQCHRALIQRPKMCGETSLKRPRVKMEYQSSRESGKKITEPVSQVRSGVAVSLPDKNSEFWSPKPSLRDERSQPTSSLPTHSELHPPSLADKMNSVQRVAGPDPPVTDQRDKLAVNDRSNIGICSKESSELGTESLPNTATSKYLTCPARPIDAHRNQRSHASSSNGNGDIRQINCYSAMAGRHADRMDGKKMVPSAACSSQATQELTNIQETSLTEIEIASSASGDVKLSFVCHSPDFHQPRLEHVFKIVEAKCLRSYKILEPNFSLMNLMKEICKCASELGSKSLGKNQENIVNIIPAIESLKKSGYRDLILNDLSTSAYLNNESRRSKGEKNFRDRQPLNMHSHNLAVVQQQEVGIDNIRPLHDVSDISKGEEKVRISVANEISDERYPQSFYYIPHNIVYQNGYVNVSLARIGDESCCSDCFGDCLAASIPCACARETGGIFAYTTDGLLRGDFLDDCISTNRGTQKDRQYFCQDCPLERSKNEVRPEPCKGHVVRRFVKECWSKCGCNKQCGNRIVQRGITCNLQVFFISQKKGWGVRTLDKIQRGAFVCEYVGEILTNMELYDRTVKVTGNAKHTYPVLLDADWGSEGVLKDEEALCLDATFYGNVGRFINHRCYDANLIEIPVEVETPDHHYYHLAFFTTRDIETFEELTWDYGIDFDDHSHPVKAFRCRCGSRFCRDKHRVKETKSGALVLR